MKKMLLLASLLLIAAVPALAVESICNDPACGVDLGWAASTLGGDCQQYAGLAQTKTFACAVNTGGNLLVVGFQLAAPIQCIGLDVFLYGMTNAATVPPWWQMGAGECRAASLTVNNVFGGDGSGCQDAFGGLSSGGLAGFFDGANPSPFNLPANRDRMEVVWAVPTNQPSALSAGVEYFATNIKIMNTNTTTCTGCLSGHIWALSLVQVADEFNMVDLDKPFVNGAYTGQQCVYWQNNTSLPCAAPVPAKSSTWGQIKSLYR